VRGVTITACASSRTPHTAASTLRVMRSFRHPCSSCSSVRYHTGCPWQELDATLTTMPRTPAMPAFVLRFMKWGRGTAVSNLEVARRRHADLTAKRSSFVAGLRQLEAELAEKPPRFPPNELTAVWMGHAGSQWALRVRTCGGLSSGSLPVGWSVCWQRLSGWFAASPPRLLLEQLSVSSDLAGRLSALRLLPASQVLLAGGPG
jgi:hypothetical protein